MSEREVKAIGASSPLLRYLTGSDADEPRSLLVVPLVSRGEILGIVTAAAPVGQVFTRGDASLAAELARHGSLAIDNARLYLESQQALRAREECWPSSRTICAIRSMPSPSPLRCSRLRRASRRRSRAARHHRSLRAANAASDRGSPRRDALEGGKRLPIDPAAVEVGPLLSETYELFKAQAATSGISLQYEAAEKLPPVYADRHRILQVLSNLIGNAMKFTPSGGTIRFGAETRDSDVLFTVSDSGPGIPQEHLGDIFNPYWQANAPSAWAPDSIAYRQRDRRSTRRRIWVESEQGRERDSTLHFRWPRRTRASARHARGISSTSLTLSSANSRIRPPPSSSEAS